MQRSLVLSNENSKEETTSLETIREMAKLTMISNRINDIQARNLKMYPFVFFDGVKSAHIDYDFSTKSLVDTEEDQKNMQIKYQLKPETKNFKVIYRLDIDQENGNTNLDRRFEALKASIANLFWSGIAIEVYFNGKIAYKSVE